MPTIVIYGTILIALTHTLFFMLSTDPYESRNIYRKGIVRSIAFFVCGSIISFLHREISNIINDPNYTIDLANSTEPFTTIIIMVSASFLIIFGVIALLKSHDDKTTEEVKKVDLTELQASLIYKDYIKAVEESSSRNKDLYAAAEIVKKLHEETSERKVQKIESFNERYLPFITRIINNRNKAPSEAREALRIFRKSIEEFYNSLYEDVKEATEVDAAVVKSLAMRDGLYNPMESFMKKSRF